jgi:hypothetical protein
LVIPDLSNVDLQSAHVPFDAIRDLLGIGILLFAINFPKICLPEPFS